jgi:D-sedoheptulose 7-phosphate isomerase
MPESEPMQSLYPFLYAGRADVDGVLAEVARSTASKAAEIVALNENKKNLQKMI